MNGWQKRRGVFYMNGRKPMTKIKQRFLILWILFKYNTLQDNTYFCNWSKTAQNVMYIIAMCIVTPFFNLTACLGPLGERLRTWVV